MSIELSSIESGYGKVSSSETERESTSFHGMNTLHFDVSFFVTQKNKQRAILSNVSDIVHSGQMLAIMGPSGAGKTTLLRVLTKEALGGSSVGVVTLNGEPLSTSVFKHRCGLVAQEDYHWAFLTCRETISFAADLLLPNESSQSKTKKVDQMINKMGLDSCADTLVGNSFKQGLSGGQKRRLSLAVTLMKRLEIIFLDEPTSGLDAAAATGIMQFVADITRRENLISIFTVHQPSTTIFNTFDRVMLLSKGRIAFCGQKSYVSQYLTEISCPLPLQTNPAEFMLDIVNTDFTDDASVDKILDSWLKIGQPGHAKRIDSVLASIALDLKSTEKSGHDATLTNTVELNVAAQSLIMFRRHALLAVRDPMIYGGRILIFFISTIFFAIIYVHARKRNQAEALQRLWFLIWCCGVPCNMAVTAVYVFNIEFFTIKKEVKNGMVSPSSYLFANSILQIPVMFIFALASLGVSGYGIISFTPSHFGQVFLIFALTMYSFESIAQFLAVSFSNPLLGMLQFLNLWFVSFLFCGIFIPISGIVWPFRVFSYIMPYRYTFRSLAYQEYINSKFSGAYNCNVNDDSSCPPSGFRCNDPSGPCYGYTGGQVLDSIHTNFDLFEKTNTFGVDVGILIAIAIAAKLIFIILMTWKSRKESHIEAPSADGTSKSGHIAAGSMTKEPISHNIVIPSTQ